MSLNMIKIWTSAAKDHLQKLFWKTLQVVKLPGENPTFPCSDSKTSHMQDDSSCWAINHCITHRPALL